MGLACRSWRDRVCTLGIGRSWGHFRPVMQGSMRSKPPGRFAPQAPDRRARDVTDEPRVIIRLARIAGDL